MLLLNDARKRKFELLASLKPFEIELLDIASSPGGHIFGFRPAKRDPDEMSRGRIALTYPARQVSVRKKVHDERVVDDGQTTVDGLVRTGWLRFAPMPHHESNTGYFWLTDDAHRVWALLDRPPKTVWWSF